MSRIWPTTLDVGLQGEGKALLQLVYHAALNHAGTIWEERKGIVAQVGRPERSEGRFSPAQERSSDQPPRQREETDGAVESKAND